MNCECDLCKKYGENIHFMRMKIDNHKNKILDFNYCEDISNEGMLDIDKKVEEYLDTATTEEEGGEGTFSNISIGDPIGGVVGTFSFIKYDNGDFWMTMLDGNERYSTLSRKDGVIRLIEFLKDCWGNGNEFCIGNISVKTSLKFEEVEKR